MTGWDVAIMNVFLLLAQMGLWLLAGFIGISSICWLLVYGIDDIRGNERFGNWFVRTLTRYNYREIRFRRLRDGVWAFIFYFAAHSPYLYIYRRIKFPDSFRYLSVRFAHSRHLCLKPWGWRHDWLIETKPSHDPAQETYTQRVCRRCCLGQDLMNPKWYKKRRWGGAWFVSDNWFDV